MIKQTILLMLAGGFLFSSCKKYGCTDENSVNYSNVANKDDGSCFVKADINNVNSGIYTINSWDWTGDGDGYSVTKSCDIITSDIAINGAVLCYFKIGNDYIQVPYSSWSGSTWTSHYIFSYAVGSFSLFTQDDDGNTFQPSDPIDVKIVVVGKNAISTNPNVDFTNYEEVKETFNL